MYLRAVLLRFDQLFAACIRRSSQRAEGQQSQSKLDRHDEEHKHKHTEGENGTSLPSVLQNCCEAGGVDINMGDGESLEGR